MWEIYSVEQNVHYTSQRGMVCSNVNVNGQNNRYWCSENPHEFCEIPLPDLVSLACSECQEDHRGSVLWRNSKFLLLCGVNSDTILQRINRRKNISYFMQDCAMSHTADLSVTALFQQMGDNLQITTSSFSRLESMWLLFVGVHWESTCEQECCKNGKVIFEDKLFKTRALSCTEKYKYFQKVWDLHRSRKLELKNSYRK